MHDGPGMTIHTGRCLCGALRYETFADPIRVTLCHCRFCQRATGAAYMVEPIFQLEHLRLTKGEPKIYHSPSGGSGKLVYIHFCAACGSLVFGGERGRSDSYTIYAGSLDDPSQFQPKVAIFASRRAPWAVIPPGLKVFDEMPPQPPRQG